VILDQANNPCLHTLFELLTCGDPRDFVYIFYEDCICAPEPNFSHFDGEFHMWSDLSVLGDVICLIFVCILWMYSLVWLGFQLLPSKLSKKNVLKSWNCSVAFHYPYLVKMVALANRFTKKKWKLWARSVTSQQGHDFMVMLFEISRGVATCRMRRTKPCIRSSSVR
jgi:hypothetical protein